MTLRWIGFVVPRGELVSQRDAVSVAATLPRLKGQRGFVRGEAWWELERIEVFHSIKTMLRKLRGSCRVEDRSRIRTKKLDLKSNCGPTTA